MVAVALTFRMPTSIATPIAAPPELSENAPAAARVWMSTVLVACTVMPALDCRIDPAAAEAVLLSVLTTLTATEPATEASPMKLSLAPVGVVAAMVMPAPCSVEPLPTVAALLVLTTPTATPAPTSTLLLLSATADPTASVLSVMPAMA